MSATPTGKKVAVAGLTFETNSFSPDLTHLDTFQRFAMVEGADLFTAGLGKDEIAGAMEVAAQMGIELVPTTTADGGCGPTVSDQAYAFLKERFVTGLAKVINEVDGVYLRLHGAMTTESCEDVEGDLIAAVREMVTPDFPIAVSCDLHAHFTAKMAQGTDLIAGYQTCPHIDFFNTGKRAMRLVGLAVTGQAKPKLSYRKLKMISPAEGIDTTIWPLKDVKARIHEIEKLPGVLDATIFCTQPWLDVSELGWSALVVTDANIESSTNLGQQYADEIANSLWDFQDEFLFTKVDIADAVKTINASTSDQRPFVFADGSDSTSGGSTGDSSFFLAALISNPIHGQVLMSITDKPAAQACAEAGVGATITLNLGGTRATKFFKPLQVTGIVTKITDGCYQSKYPSKLFNVGTTALLKIDEIEIVITSNPAFMLDYQLYDHMGLDVTKAKAVQAKSAGGYRAYYEPIAFACIDVNAPGPSDNRLSELPFTRPKRPLWPLDLNVSDRNYQY